MPTSASTGTRQTSTAGSKATKAKAAKPQVDPSDPTTVPTPDGAPVVTRAEDVVGGVRVDLAPSPPQEYDGPAPLADHNGDGIIQSTRPDGVGYIVQN